MTDLDFGIRFRVDGRGLVGEARAGANAVRETGKAADAAGTAARGASAHVEAYRRSLAAKASAATTAGKAAQTEARGTRDAGQANRQADAHVQALTRHLREKSKASADAAFRAKELAKAQGVAIRSTGQQAALSQNLAFQIQDVAQQAALGVNPMTIFAQQGGQVAFALQGAGGAVGRFAGFLSGPFGAAVLGGVTIVGALATSFFSARAEAKEAANDLPSFTEALDEARVAAENLTDAERILIDVQGQSILTAREAALQALKLAEARQVEAKETLALAEAELALLEARQANLLDGNPALSGLARGEEGQVRATTSEARQRLDDARAAVEASAGTLDSVRQKLLDEQDGLPALSEFFAGTAFATDETAKNLREAESAAKAAAREAAKQLATEEKRADRFEDILAGLAQETDLIGRSADERERIVTLARAEEALQRDLTAIEAERVETAVRLRQEAEARAEVEKGLAEFARSRLVDRNEFEAITTGLDPRARAAAERDRTLQRLGQARSQGLFGSDAEFEAAVKRVEDRYEQAMRSAGRALRDEGLIAAEAIGQAIGGKAGDALGGIVGIIEGARTGDFTAIGGRTGGFATILSSVFGGPEGDFQKGLKSVFTDVFGGSGGLGRSLTEAGDKLEDILNGVGVKGSLGEIGGRAAGGAAIGTGADAVLDALGLRSSRLTAQIGGGIGSAVGGPIGGIVGSVLGGLTGGLFKSTRRGAAIATGVDGPLDFYGNSSSRQDAAAELVGAGQEAIRNIADALGGGTGSFRGSLAIRKDNIVFDPQGRGFSKTSRFRDLQNFGQDQDGAVAAFVADAIGDGAVTGLSAAVSKALRSSTDLDAALEEALSVQALEESLAGVSSLFQREVQLFEETAAERLRIARQYGFDVTQIEQRNADDRERLTRELLAGQVGQLQDFLRDLDVGSLAAGSPTERLGRLRGEIETVRTAAQGGDADASTRLAGLLREFVTLSEEANGTAGGFAGDRTFARAAATDVVSEAERALTEARKQTSELSEANDLAAETNMRLKAIEDAIARAGGTGGISGGVAGPIFRNVSVL